MDSSPIYGILCDGNRYEFFRLNRSTKPAIFSRGIITQGDGQHPFDAEALRIADFSGTSASGFIKSLRPVCEAIFSLFLLSYVNGIEAYFQRSLERNQYQPLKSTSVWASCHALATNALELALAAAAKAADGDIISANETAELALNKLKDRFSLLHHRSLKCPADVKLPSLLK